MDLFIDLINVRNGFPKKLKFRVLDLCGGAAMSAYGSGHFHRQSKWQWVRYSNYPPILTSYKPCFIVVTIFVTLFLNISV